MKAARRLAVAGALGLALVAACGEDEPREPSWHALPGLEAHGWLVSATASPDGSRWLAVGGTPERGIIARESAKGQWTLEQTPELPLLNWGQLFADGTGFVVGNAGAIVHYDGAHWTRQSTPIEEDLWGVWGAAPNDVWAVGGRGQQDGQATLLHYDGAAWQQVALPALERPNVWALFKVWGASASDVYAVGQRGAVLHYDGTTWSELGLGTGDDLIAVYGVAADRVAIVGGRSSGFIATFDGSRWNTQQLAPLPGLNGVFMNDPSTIHVAGIQGTIAELDFATLTVRPAYQSTSLTFHALHGAGKRLLAVGGNLMATSGPYLGLAAERPLEAP